MRYNLMNWSKLNGFPFAKLDLMSSLLTLKIFWRRSGVFIVNFEQVNADWVNGRVFLKRCSRDYRDININSFDKNSVKAFQISSVTANTHLPLLCYKGLCHHGLKQPFHCL